MSKLFTFEGRARRSEYWYFFLFVAILDLSLRVTGMVYDNYIQLYCGEGDANVFRYSGSIIELIEYVVISFMGLSVTVRRLHDIDCSGWLALLFVALPFFLCMFIVHVFTSPDSLLHQPGIPQNVKVNGLTAMIMSNVLLMVIEVVTIVLFCKPGTEGPNAYGPDPICFENEPNNAG